MKNNKKQIYFLAILIAIVCISIAPKTFQNDTFFTIAGGKNILEKGIQEIDTLTWHENLKFTNDRYVFDIIIAIIYNLNGFFGIYLFVMIFCAIIGVTYYILLVKRGYNYVLSFLSIILIMFCGGVGIIAARAQIISILIFIIEVYCLEKLLETNKKRYWISLIILPLILANTHASIFPVYFVFFLPYIAENILTKIKWLKTDGDKIFISKRKHIKSLYIILILGILSGFCTPIGEAPFTSMFKAAIGVSTEEISELQPITPIYRIDFMLFNIIFFAIVAFTKTKINIADLFLVLGLDILALSSYRTIFYLTFIASIVNVKLINEFLKSNSIYEIKINPKTKQIFFAIIFIITIFISAICFAEKIKKEYVDITEYPVDVCKYILENIDTENMKIYNEFNYGSYLEFKNIKSFIDSRSGMFCREFNENVSILEDFFSFSTLNYNEIFDKYEITHALLKNNPEINYVMHNDNKWKQIYQDDSFTLYERVNQN